MIRNALLVHLAAITIVIATVYSKLPYFEFLIGWDDQWFVLNEYTEAGFSSQNVYNILTDFYRGQYAPLNQLYYTLVHHFFQYDARYYHILNVVIHLANVIVVYFLSRRFALQLEDINKTSAGQIGFFTAVLFAILPVNLEPVAWVAASKVGIYAFFYLLALQTYCEFLITGKAKYYYLTILLFILSFGAKEQAVTLPLSLILLDVFYKRSFATLMQWYEKIPFFLLSLLFGLITIQSQALDVDRAASFYPLGERVVLSMYTVTEYFTKTLLPLNLSYLYPFPYLVGEEMPKWLWIQTIGLPCAVCLLIPQLNRERRFGLTFFIIHIVLVANLFSLARFSIVADRYAYIATIGICFIVGCFLVRTLSNLGWHRGFALVVMAYYGLLGLYSFHHSEVWNNARTLKSKLRQEIRNRSDYPELQIKEIRQ